MEKQYVYCLLLFAVSIAKGYDYDSNGADWSGTCSSGTKQSPVDIVTANAIFNVSFGEFTFTNYSLENVYSKIKNNGHTIQVDMAASNVKLSGGGLVSGQYTLAQFHIHFGNTSSTGSEHTIDSKQYPLEVHFVHYADQYSDITTAAAQADGLAVLGFLFEIQATDNNNLDFFVNMIMNVTKKDETVDIVGPGVNSLFRGVGLTNFFRYSGSLTTPTCDEVVQWTLFNEKIKISESQMNLIRATYLDTNGTTLIGKNYRAVQNLAGREVQKSFSSAATQNSPCIAIIVVLTVYCLDPWSKCNYFV